MIIHTRIESSHLAGNLLGDPSERDLFVYLPPGYEGSDRGYPTAYLRRRSILLRRDRLVCRDSSKRFGFSAVVLFRDDPSVAETHDGFCLGRPFRAANRRGNARSVGSETSTD